MTRARVLVRRRSKYAAVRTTVDNITFASKAEARRYRELRLLEKAGEISSLECQPVFSLYADSMGGSVEVCEYRADFRYYDKHNKEIVEDVKSKPTRTPVYVLKRKLMRS